MGGRKQRKKEQEPREQMRNEIPESTKQKKRLGKKKEFSDYFELKVEIADELGLLEKVKKHGWGGLSAEESGRIGGHITRVLRQREGAVARDDTEEQADHH
jgi:hypothetical protein